MMSKVDTIYVITGDDKGNSRVRQFNIVDETDKKWLARNKRFTKSKENDPIGQVFNWTVWSTDELKAKEIRLEMVEHNIPSYEQMIEFLYYQLDRDYPMVIKRLNTLDDDKAIYNKMKDLYDVRIQKMENIIEKIKENVKLLKEEMK